VKPILVQTLVLECGLSLLALWLAPRMGVDLGLMTRISWRILLWATLATVPLLLALGWSLTSQVRWVVRLRKVSLNSLVPLLRECSFQELIWIALAAGIGEELLFRGVLLTAWSRNWGLLLALLVTSMLFGLMHPVSAAYVAGAAAIGMYLGVLMWWSDELLVPIWVHVLYDAVALIAIVKFLPADDLETGE